MKEKKAKKQEKKSAQLQLPKKKNQPVSKGEPEPGEKVDVIADNSLLRLTGTLCLLCAVCGLVLGLANLLTEERIAENQGSRNMGVLEEVLPYGGDYREVRYTGSDPSIEAAYEAPEAGWVFEVSPAGSYSGNLTLMVGVNIDGTVSGVAVTESGESEGLGLRASESEFRDQFIGLTGTVWVEADGGTINAISGATVTSRAVCAGVSSALKAAAELG